MISADPRKVISVVQAVPAADRPGLHGALRHAASRRVSRSTSTVAANWRRPSRALGLCERRGGGDRAAAVAGDTLVGVVAFGSWTAVGAAGRIRHRPPRGRGPQPRAVPHNLSRWDEKAVLWNGRRVEPHFVTMPERSPPAVGLWRRQLSTASFSSPAASSFKQPSRRSAVI